MSRRDLLFSLILLLATVGVYSQVTHLPFVNFDDPDYTTANPHIRGGLTAGGVAWAFTSSYQANWMPLTFISHMLDFQFHSANAGMHHVTNLVLHCLNVVLLFFLLRKMSGSSAASAFTALVFAVHPLHVESVAWIAERKDLLCTFFFLLTIAAYLFYLDRPAGRAGRIRYALVALAFACALMSKPMAITLPFVLLLLDHWPLRRFTTTPAIQLIREKLPLFALSLASAIITFVSQSGAGAVIEGIPFSARLENALASYAVYVVKFLWPVDLAVFYPYEPIPLWQPIAAAIGIAAITALVIQQRLKRPYLLVGWFWYLGMLVPVIGLIQVGAQSHADRYTYLPLVGISMMIAWRIKGFFIKRRWLRPPITLLGLIACGALAIAARADLQYWQSGTALFQHASDVTHDNFVAYTNLGTSLTDAGNPEQSIQYFNKALELVPHFADAEEGIGRALTAMGRFDEAMPHLVESARLDPNSVSVHVSLGAALQRAKRPQEAVNQFQMALQLDPPNSEAHTGLGDALDDLGRTAEAMAQFREAIRLNPNNADAHYNLGRMLGLQGHADEAMTEFREAIRVQPSNAEAHFNLATALAVQDRMRQAAEEFRTAVELKPNYINARFGYASALASMGNYTDAIPQFEALLRMQPGFVEAQQSLKQCIYLRDHPGAAPGTSEPPRHRRKKKAQ